MCVFQSCMILNIPHELLRGWGLNVPDIMDFPHDINLGYITLPLPWGSSHLAPGALHGLPNTDIISLEPSPSARLSVAAFSVAAPHLMPPNGCAPLSFYTAFQHSAKPRIDPPISANPGVRIPSFYISFHSSTSYWLLHGNSIVHNNVLMSQAAFQSPWQSSLTLGPPAITSPGPKLAAPRKFYNNIDN